MAVYKAIGLMLSIGWLSLVAYSVSKGVVISNDFEYLGVCILLAGFMAGGTKGD